MTALYITSPEKGTGKTAICALLGQQLAAKGKKVGYFKPVTITAGSTASDDTDAEFMKQLLSLSEPEDSVRPVITLGANLNKTIKDAYDKVSQGKDIVIVEGSAEQFVVAHLVAASLDAKVIIVEGWSQDMMKSTDYKRFGQSLVGVILNKVPKTRMEQAQAAASARITNPGEKLLGVLPEDRQLMALSVGELTESIGGQVLNDSDKSEELVSDFMLGALGLDPGIDYFGRKSDKAVILKGERPDLALAALYTSTRCLVLGGSYPVNQRVMNTARNKNIPIITVKDSVADTVAKVEDAVVKTRFNQVKKMPHLTEFLEQRIDTAKLLKAVGAA